MKVFLPVIETTLSEHDGIDFAWCAAVGESDVDRRIEAAILVKVDEETKDADALTSVPLLRKWLKEKLPTYMIPTRVHLLDEHPTKVTGKRVPQREAPKFFSNLQPLGSSDAPGGGAVATSPSLLTGDQQLVAAAWLKVLGDDIPPLQPTDSFFDLGGSLKFTQLASELKCFNSGTGDIAVSDLLGCPTLEEMTTYLLALGEGNGAAGAEAPVRTVPDFDTKAAADKYPFAYAAPEDPTQSTATIKEALESFNAKPTKVVLVTGSTGYVGAYATMSLASHPSVSKVYAVVRAKDVPSARQRLLDASAGKVLPGLADDWLDRVECICGDVGKPGMGLSEADQEMLTESVDAVLNAAAVVNMLKPYSALADVNVGGLRNVLDFCAVNHLPHLFTSTILPLEGEEPTGYRRSKEVGEELVLRAQVSTTAAVPSSVLQLGDIGMSNAAGSFLPGDDAVVVMLRACVELGAWPSVPSWALSVMTVDQCTDLLTSIIVNGSPADFTGEARETKGNLVAWDTMMGWCTTHLPLTPLPLDEWKQLMQTANASPSGSDGSRNVQRAELLLPGLVDEWHAEGLRMAKGEGQDQERLGMCGFVRVRRFLFCPALSPCPPAPSPLSGTYTNVHRTGP